MGWRRPLAAEIKNAFIARYWPGWTLKSIS
jgi:hypothetical protein